MTNAPVLYGPDGQPIRREVLTQAVAGPTITGVRSPITNYPSDGLNPRRLASLLRHADQGEPLRYFELAEQIEEKDLHYTGVLGTRKRSVSQLDITVEAAGDDAASLKHAELVEGWLARDELQAELFDMLDAIGKGISFTEIIWDTSEGQWQLGKLEWRDPRWFRFKREDGTTPLLRGDMGDTALPAFKFITAVIRAKSGLPVRSGLARLAAWSWMFKAFTQRDWAIFTQTYGQPVRVGKYPIGTTEDDKNTLFRAVANIAGDCAAIIPEGMTIDFIQAPNVGAGIALYKDRADWLDQQMSKAVLGQTATTDAVIGGLGSGKEHRQVQEDIERADAKALSAILNRDLVRAGVQLEFGPQKRYPRLKIGRGEEENLTQTIDGVVKLVGYGLEVEASVMRDKLGLPEPAPGAKLLVAPQPAPTPGGPLIPFGAPGGVSRVLHAAQPARRTADAVSRLAQQAQALADPAQDDMIDAVRNVVMSAASWPDLRDRLAKLKLPTDKLASALQLALVMAQLTGRADIANAAAQP